MNHLKTDQTDFKYHTRRLSWGEKEILRPEWNSSTSWPRKICNQSRWWCKQNFE